MQKPIPALLLLCSLCFSQTINISGTVTDTAGTPLAGALVQLEQGGLSDSTEGDGIFLLSGVVGISDKSNQTLPHKLSASIHNGRLVITAAEKSAVKITAFTLRGEAVFEMKETMEAGTHSFALPRTGAGVYLFRIQSGSSVFFIKRFSIGGVSQGSAVSVHGSFATVSAVPDIIDDVIKVTNAGYLNSRIPVTNSDTSGMEIALILQDAGIVTDIDGNVYHAIRIGNQVWTVENLCVTKYNDSTDIPHLTDSADWVNDTNGAYCYYDNTTNADTIAKFGPLYNWHAVNTGKLAPEGWHVPTIFEWDTLENYLISNGYNWDGTTSGNKIAKSMAAKTDWNSANTVEGNAGNDLSSNNSSGFSALPGGFRYFNGVFYFVGYKGMWWSATGLGTDSAYRRDINCFNEDLNHMNHKRVSGYSVKLVKD